MGSTAKTTGDQGTQCRMAAWETRLPMPGLMVDWVKWMGTVDADLGARIRREMEAAARDNAWVLLVDSRIEGLKRLECAVIGTDTLTGIADKAFARHAMDCLKLAQGPFGGAVHIDVADESHGRAAILAEIDASLARMRRAAGAMGSGRVQ